MLSLLYPMYSKCIDDFSKTLLVVSGLPDDHTHRGERNQNRNELQEKTQHKNGNSFPITIGLYATHVSLHTCITIKK